ncbi:MAG: hypothetical protein AAFR94_01165 [Pseudomonadota bacterium]
MALRFMTVVLVVVFACGPRSSDAQDIDFPSVSGYSLDGEKVVVPFATSNGERLIILAFGDMDAPDVADWQSRFHALAAEGTTLPVKTFVIMGEANRFTRAARAGRLRAKVDEPDIRAQIVPVFRAPETFLTALGLSGRSEVAAVLVRSGEDVVWRHEGPPTDQALTDLRSILAGAPTATSTARSDATPDSQPGQPTSPNPVKARPAIVAPTAAAATVPHSNDAPVDPPAPEVQSLNSVPDVPHESPVAELAPEIAISPEPPKHAEHVPAIPKNGDGPLERLQPLSGYDLEGRRVELPGSLSEGRTLLLLRTSIDAPDADLAWRAMVSDTGYADTHLMSLVILRDRGFGRSVMSGRVRARIADPGHRRTTIPIFLSRAEQRSMPVDMGADGFAALIVDSTGQILSVLESTSVVNAAQSAETLIGPKLPGSTSER